MFKGYKAFKGCREFQVRLEIEEFKALRVT